jgi:hypothetical protein
MAFAIKITDTQEGIFKYYSQTITTLKGDIFSEIILLTDGVDSDEVDISKTLIEAEKKIDMIKKHFLQGVLKAKIVEFPEAEDYDGKKIN